MKIKSLLHKQFADIWDIRLPCDIKVDSMTIKKGVHLKTLFIALSRREDGGKLYEFYKKYKL